MREMGTQLAHGLLRVRVTVALLVVVLLGAEKIVIEIAPRLADIFSEHIV